LCQEQIQEFIENGVLVIPNLISEEELLSIRKGFHNYLRSEGCDENDLAKTAINLGKLSSTGGAGGILDVFYEPWKLNLNENNNVVGAMQDLWSCTYASNNENFNHPYGEFNPNRGYMYIDRICYRIPTAISNLFATGNNKKFLQRSLTPHLDCCPHDMYPTNALKWRPIQAFIALTDTLQANEGGFEACVGFHKNFDTWAIQRPSSFTDPKQPPPCVGNFSPIRPKEDEFIIKKFQHIPCKAGDLVCWDYRIPHANSRFNQSNISREAIYIGLLPDIQLNKKYAIDQLNSFKNGLLPVDQWHSSNANQKCEYEFSQLGRCLMSIDEWT
jgi:ectoine hydroxylase-related dioxygenase (phytanoyl-CoA dioxygenase family)